MGDINEYRKELKKAYPGSIVWAEKVDKMSANQVLAIYYRLRNSGQLRR